MQSDLLVKALLSVGKNVWQSRSHCELSDNTDIQPEEPNQRFHPAWGLNREPEPYRSVPNLEGASLSVGCFIQLGQDKIKLNLKNKSIW